MKQEKGNIYLAEIQSVAYAYKAAFVDYGSERDGFLPFTEIMPAYRTRTDYRTGEKIAGKGTVALVQVKKEATEKGALLTTYLTLCGKYMVLKPDRSLHGVVSRRLSENEETERLRKIATELSEKYDVSFVIHEEAQNHSKEELEQDLLSLIEENKSLKEKSTHTKTPALLYKAPQKSDKKGLFAKIKSLFLK